MVSEGGCADARRRIDHIIPAFPYHDLHDSPIFRINTLFNITVKTRIRPIAYSFCPAMFNRIPMNIINVSAGEIKNPIAELGLCGTPHGLLNTLIISSSRSLVRFVHC